eukprot:UN22150
MNLKTINPVPKHLERHGKQTHRGRSVLRTVATLYYRLWRRTKKSRVAMLLNVFFVCEITLNKNAKSTISQ